MNMRNRTIRHWLGHLVLITMLFTQSALLWAQVNAQVPSQHPMQHKCHSLQVNASDSVQSHCKSDCCQPSQSCSSHCLSTCVTAGVTLLPTAVMSVLPYFDTTSTHLALALSPDGIHITVLKRPPRQLI